jgi:serine/threonine protein kinase
MPAGSTVREATSPGRDVTGTYCLQVHACHEQLIPIDRDGTPVWLFHWHQSIGDVHPCAQIVSCYGSFADRTALRVHLCMEYMHGGSLEQLLGAGRQRPPERLLRYIAHCCLLGLAHMERHQIVHRDIKPANILVNGAGEVKIGDLGLACHLDSESDTLRSGEGTQLFLSPERIDGKGYESQHSRCSPPCRCLLGGGDCSCAGVLY